MIHVLKFKYSTCIQCKEICFIFYLLTISIALLLQPLPSSSKQEEAGENIQVVLLKLSQITYEL